MADAKPECAPLDLDAALDEIEESGCTVSAYARERGLSTWRLYKGRRRRRREAQPAKGTARRDFVAVRLSPVPRAAAPFELVLGGGWTLRIPESFDESALRRLLQVLERC